MRRVLPLLFCLGVIASAQAGAPKPACEPDYAPGCKWLEAGDLPLDAVAVRGDETMRFDHRAFLRPSKRFAIEVSRDSKGIVRIAIHAPVVQAQMVSRVVPASAWPRFVALRAKVIAVNAAALARIGAQNPRRLETHGGRSMVMCLDPGRLSIGSALRRKAQEIALDTCATREVDAIADQIHDAAYDLLPFCAKMTETVAFGCGSLAGDGDMAAAFADTVLAAAAPCAAQDRPALTQGALLRIADSPAGPGGTWRGRKIFAALCRRSLRLMVGRITAERGGLTVTGRTFWGTGEAADGLSWPALSAPTVQVWRIDGGKAKLEQWTIEKFAPVPPMPPVRAPMPQKMPR